MFLIQKTIFHYHGSPWHLFGHWKRPLFVRELLIQLALAVSLTVGGVMVLQVAYPRSWALPQTRIGGQNFGLRSERAITQTINQVNTRGLQIEVGDTKLSHTPQEIGVRVNGAADAEKVTAYTWRERLMPFSLFFAQRNVPGYSTEINEPKARKFLESLAAYNKPAVDAQVKLQNAHAVLVPASPGYTYDANAMLPEVKELDITKDLTLELAPIVVAPAITDDTATKTAETINARVARPLTVEAAGKTIAIDGQTLSSLIIITPDPANKTFTVSYDRAKIAQALSKLASQVYAPATTGSTVLLDGEATDRGEGGNGRALSMDASIDAVVAAWNNDQTKATAVVRTVASTTRVTRMYTRSSKGLQALMTQWTQNNGGTYGIALRTMDGGISASYNGGGSFTPASIYKMYVAYVVYTKVANGEISLNSTTSTGASVGSCMEVMIVRSDNPCAHALGDMIGWQSGNPMLRAKGFGSTSLGPLTTTANDTASLLVQLQSGSLLNGEHTSSLLSMMHRQVYRSGIPAGSSGAVANKVGFLGGLNHDAAIVYHPRGTYALVVLSSGSSFARIADLSRQISALMSQ